MKFNVKTEIGGRTLSIQSGEVANQASGSVIVKYGDTVVLVAVVSEKGEKESNFLPLSVEYQEKIYAAGRIPGNYFRREIGRPSEKEILTSRLIDRPIRPLFSKGYKHETQIIATVLSVDHENDPDILAMIGASAALEISDIPFNGPIAAVRVGRIDGEFVINPINSQMELCDLNIVVASSNDGIVMVEGGGCIVDEKDVLDAIFFGEKRLVSIFDIQEKMRVKVGKAKRLITIDKNVDPIVKFVRENVFDHVERAMLISTKIERKNELYKIKNKIFSNLREEWKEKEKIVDEVFNNIQKEICRDLLLKDKRIDGRAYDEIRPIYCRTGLLQRTHGSSLFTRGETQVLGVLTLGSGQDEQRVETLNGEEHRKFMLHYNFPPFSVGEVKRVGSPSRRDIGHGGLATRALENILPDKKIFDYTIRIVSEVLESNGSSSMGTVCAGTLAMMDGGVPIKGPVAGIAMGLIKDNEKVLILSDILGDEDNAGDMDFKVAGTKDGITAIQMDIKISGLSKEIMQKSLMQAKYGRLEILDKMLDTIECSRKNISQYAPRIKTISIPLGKIKDVIGPGGKIIRELQSKTNTRIEIADDGIVKITANSYDEIENVTDLIGKITLKPQIGKIYNGRVINIVDFGAFVQIAPGVDGLVHISQLANHRVEKVTDVVSEGDDIKVKVLEISKDGKIRLSRKVVKQSSI